MAARLTIGDVRRLMRAAGVKDVTGEKARRVRMLLEDAGVLVPAGPARYELGPMVRFQGGIEKPPKGAACS